MIHRESINPGQGIEEVTIDRPPVNALDIEHIEMLRDQFGDIEADPDIRGVVVTGSGPAFSAGVDTKAFHRYGVAEVDPGLIHRVVVGGLTVAPSEAVTLRLLDDLVPKDDLRRLTQERVAQFADLPAFADVKAQFRAVRQPERARVEGPGMS